MPCLIDLTQSTLPALSFGKIRREWPVPVESGVLFVLPSFVERVILVRMIETNQQRVRPLEEISD